MNQILRFLKTRPLLIILEILVVFILTIAFDRMLGFYYAKTFHYKSYAPNITVHYESSEFKYDVFTSSQGLRNEEVPLKKDAGKRRILAIGDSFTLGWGVELEKSWPKVLEQKFMESGKAVEVINAGVAGGDLSLYTEVCRDYASVFKPDEIILGFYSTDDLAQNLVRYTEYKESPILALWPNFAKLKQGQYITSQPEINEKREQFTQDIWRYKAAQEIQAKGPLKNVSGKVAEDFEAGRINPYMVIYGQEKPDFWLLVLNKDAMGASLVATDALFSKLKECTQNIPVTVVLIPTEELVSETYHKFRQEMGFRVDDKLLYFDFDKVLSPIVKKYGFSYISPLSDFRADGCLDCYYPYDSHMTEVGYRRVAEKVFSVISEQYK